MDVHILQKNIWDSLEIENVPENEKAVLLKDVADIVIHATLARIVEDMDEKEIEQMQAFLENEPDLETLFTRLDETSSQFAVFLEEEIVRVKEDMVAILGDGQGGRGV